MMMQVLLVPDQSEHCLSGRNEMIQVVSACQLSRSKRFTLRNGILVIRQRVLNPSPCP
jgi:hypothetical protein